MITGLYTGFLIVAILILTSACVPEEERQRIRKASDGRIVIKRKRNVARTTVAIGLDQAWELFWD
ncbi:MAG: hypothetical protein ISR57_03555 [Bacteroidales bacterium]|nr:hypothetical protein [Bacteroidota bacterium]MBL6949700.1 hypothetical protein [Bacteroidales bacterium]